MIRTPKACSKFRCWAGDNSSSKMHRSMSSCWAKRDSSWTLPFPMKNTGSGLGRDWTNFPTTSAPAVSASWASSSTESWALQREAVSPQAREISMARSGPSARLWPRDRLAKIFSTVWTTLPKGMAATSFALKGPNSWSTGCWSSSRSVIIPKLRRGSLWGVSQAMAAMASKRRSRRADRSTPLSRGAPEGWVWMQETPQSRFWLLRESVLGSSTWQSLPTATAVTWPFRSIYREISRLMASVRSRKRRANSILISWPSSALSS